MEDPSAQAIVRTYADALLDAADGHGADTVLEELVRSSTTCCSKFPVSGDL